jgi:hypothetical protein
MQKHIFLVFSTNSSKIMCKNNFQKGKCTQGHNCKMTSFDPSTIHKYFIRPKGGEKYGNKYNVFYAM